MESANTSDFQERRVGPTVSKDKWVNHAKAKLTKGYVLIVGKQRKTANFYLRSKGFEMCPHNVAKQLIKEGIVVEDGEHQLGTMYRLAGDVQIETKPKRKPPVPAGVDRAEPQDELDDLVPEVDDDGGEDEDLDEGELDD